MILSHILSHIDREGDRQLSDSLSSTVEMMESHWVLCSILMSVPGLLEVDVSLSRSLTRSTRNQSFICSGWTSALLSGTLPRLLCCHNDRLSHTLYAQVPMLLTLLLQVLLQHTILIPIYFNSLQCHLHCWNTMVHRELFSLWLVWCHGSVLYHAHVPVLCTSRNCCFLCVNSGGGGGLGSGADRYFLAWKKRVKESLTAPLKCFIRLIVRVSPLAPLMRLTAHLEPLPWQPCCCR